MNLHQQNFHILQFNSHSEIYFMQIWKWPLSIGWLGKIIAGPKTLCVTAKEAVLICYSPAVPNSLLVTAMTVTVGSYMRTFQNFCIWVLFQSVLVRSILVSISKLDSPRQISTISFEKSIIYLSFSGHSCTLWKFNKRHRLD